IAHPISDDQLTGLISRCPGVHRVKLKDELIRQGVTEVGLSTLFEKLTQLESLHLVGCHSIYLGSKTDGGGCTGGELQSLHLEYCRFSHEKLFQALSDCPIRLGLKEVIFSNTHISNNVLIELGKKFPGLESLEINFCHGWNDEGLKNLASGLGNLQMVDLT